MTTKTEFEVRTLEILDGDVTERRVILPSLRAAQAWGSSALGQFKAHAADIFHDGQRVAHAHWQRRATWFLTAYGESLKSF